MCSIKYRGWQYRVEDRKKDRLCSGGEPIKNDGGCGGKEFGLFDKKERKFMEKWDKKGAEFKEEVESIKQ